MTFGFVDRPGGSVGHCGTRIRAISPESRSAGLGCDPWRLLPHLLPQAPETVHSTQESHARST